MPTSGMKPAIIQSNSAMKGGSLLSLAAAVRA
jgi:hypothetical protein